MIGAVQMEREISSGAMLGIVLLALAAVIGLGFGVFAITKGVANEGTVGVQDSLGTVSTQVFLDYDQKVVSGQQVVSGLKTFEGKPYAVLIATKALQQSGAKASPNHSVYPVGEGATKGSGVTAFINYNAILAGTTTPGVKPNPTTGTPAGVNVTSLNNVITLKNGSYLNTNGLASTNGNVDFDKDTAGIFKTGNAEYVSTSAKFQAYLIKDSSDNIMGIAAIQQ